MNTYTPQSIEKKWQEIWLKEKTAATPSAVNKKKKRYILDMFPYPSGAGLHVGHPEGYTATDIIARFLRAQGNNVLHPMGWDAFGLPAENYAIKTGVHPAQSTHTNITTFRKQIQSLGFSYDWDREINTSDPSYYKWTQWIFLRLYDAGLIYRKKAKVNWCGTCQTVLANEQVIDGKCERSKDAVVQKDLEQWFFKITEYVDQLLDDLDTLDWPEPIKLMQRNWIGKKSGVTITHRVKDLDLTIDSFSAYPGWLYADTYMVIAPEHPVVAQLIADTPQQHAVEAFQKEMQKKTTAERGEAQKEKLGVFTGRYAIDPLTGNEMPLWLANFAMMDFGTGIIRCSAHDVRDFEFAQKYTLPLKEVVQRSADNPDEPINAHDNSGVLQHSGPFTGREINDALIEEMIEFFVQEGYGKRHTTYRLRDWLISRQRYWGAPIPVVYDPAGTPHPIKEEHLPLLLPTDVDYTPKGTSPLGTSETYKKLAEELYGAGWYFENDTMDTFVCSAWYYIRYCDPHNTTALASVEAMEQWLPVDLYVGGAEHAVLHLLYARFFHKALQDCGVIPSSVGREPFVRLKNQGMILGEDHQKMSKSVGNVINPDDVVEEYGADTLRLYEMFMGPFEDVKPWNTDGIKGVYRFLHRVWDVVMQHKDLPVVENKSKHIHSTIQKVTRNIEECRFNTAISEMMEFLNDRDFGGKVNEKGVVETDGVDMDALKQFLVLLHPFAPHITAELWEHLSDTKMIHEQPWPTFDAAMLEQSVVTIAVQVNGKLRDTIALAPDATEDTAQSTALASAAIQKHVADKNIARVVYVPGKIVNIIVK